MTGRLNNLTVPSHVLGIFVWRYANLFSYSRLPITVPAPAGIETAALPWILRILCSDLLLSEMHKSLVYITLRAVIG
jgi:hypothetical protein